MLGVHKSIILPQSTPYAQEMAKWEPFPSKWGAAGRPYVFREFPKMLYKASQGAEMTTITVNDPDEQRREEAKGFAATQERALELMNREHREHATLAAERNFEIAKGRISERAGAEVRQAEAEHGARHLPEVPEKPRRKRRTKAEMAAARG
jgi:hypothetical protein